jgi:hypothetical protein
VVVYDTFSKPGGYTLDDYHAKWANPYGLGEIAPGVGGTQNFNGGSENLRAVPFHVGSDTSVFDHLKYIAVSTRAFPAPTNGSVTFDATIEAQTPGTVPGLVMHGTYVQSGRPYSAKVIQGQQAGAVLNMVDFCTGQLFDWFIAGNTAFTLIERLPTNVTGNTSNPACPAATTVGRDRMYTQIIRQVPFTAHQAHRVAITYARQNGNASVRFLLDGRVVSQVGRIGIPLDRQGVHFTGTYPSLGPGEVLGNQIHAFSIGHGLFSLLDAFPFQHPEAPGLSVSIPVGNGNPADAGYARLFGQGAIASFDSFGVRTVTN